MALYQQYLSALFNKLQTPTATNNKPPTDYTLSALNYKTIYQYKFTIDELKTFAKAIKIKITGVKKDELRKRLYFYYLLQSKSLQIQRIFRGYLLRKLLQIQGNIALNRKKCINITDVITLDDIADIPAEYFYCYCDDKGDMFGFNVVSLYTILGANNETAALNPYTRMPFKKSTKQDVNRFIKLSRITGRATLKLTADPDVMFCTVKQQMEMNALGVFQTINELGNYSDVKWFLDLSRGETLRFINEFYDIWNHRAGLTSSMKKDLCPPDGVLFRRTHAYLTHEPDLYKIKADILVVFKKLVATPTILLDNKKLNAMYILAALTLVSHVAAEAMPAYYFSVA